ncbi:MFS transporter [Streptomyces sp. NPDC006372]|uniref:MFS transporter n=1 Tax=Streptomyces sp. NPDC006372 TaxID=3155599 RepID=UPI0033BD2227
MTDHDDRQRTARPGASGRVILALALVCGAAVGNVYFPQAISPLIASGLHVSPDAAAGVVTATQFGYAAGICLLVPLGDRLPYRPLLVTLLTLTGLGLFAASAAPGLVPLVCAGALVGVTTVAAPLAGPLAAGLVPEERRGVTGGTLLSGCLAGMLLSRAVGGALGDWLGWRAPYVLAAVLSLAAAVLSARVLPRTSPPPSARGGPALLTEPLRLLRTEPGLRMSCLYQALVFAGFSAVWTGAALLLTGPGYGAGAGAVGLLALVNAVTMVCTPAAGRQVDRRGPDAVNRVCFLMVGASAAVLALGGLGGAAGVTALVVGTLLLDVGMQSGTVANTVRIQALRAELRSRLTTAYMTCAYLGGAAGSWLGTRGYGRFGWLGVCALVAALTAVALASHRSATRRTAGRFRRSAAPGSGAAGPIMAEPAAATSREETP